MNQGPNHDLIGYLAGALDPAERAAIEQSLSDDRQLRSALRSTRQQLELTEDGDPAGFQPGFDPVELIPPPGLAERTLQFIAEHGAVACARENQAEALTAEAQNVVDSLEPDAAYCEPASQSSWRGAAREPLLPKMHSWRFIDLATALAVCFAGAALVIPMISASRSNAQIASCANNEREIGMALSQYSEHQNGYFPRVPEHGSLAAAGIYAPTLLSTRYVTNPRLFVCPASSVADNQNLRIPSIADLEHASGKELVELRQQMGGSYGYALGYRQDGVYRPTRNLYRPSFALLADMPSEDFTSSPNHAGRGHNVLLEDGHVVFLTSCRLDGSSDDIFTNDEGRAAAGCHINDAVVVRSDVSP
jgi:hypothetical protein